MAKKRRHSDTSSGRCFSTIESAGACSSDHWDSSATSALPVIGVPVNKIQSADSAEKDKWILKLTQELDKVRNCQQRLDLHRAYAATIYSSIIQPLVQKVNKETFSLGLRKQCENLLKKLMSHRHGWIFSKPVDIVEFGIPDYYDVIKHPMDLGTIKEKLGSGKYSSPVDFLADVRLTFTNAMTYNSPGNQVHTMADVLSKFFEKNWKPIEKKLHVNESKQDRVVEEIDIAKTMVPFEKSKNTIMMSDEEKLKLSRDLEVHSENPPDNILEFLRGHASNEKETGEDDFEVDIGDFDSDSLWKLRKMLDELVQAEGNYTEVESSVIVE